VTCLLIYFGSVSLVPVQSSAIAAVGYNPFTGTLAVLFHTSPTIYTHPGVPFAVYLGLLHADSMGAYYNRVIRGRYR
jgi:hypothetical protein